MITAASTVSNHLYGIINAIDLRKTNAVAESINSKIPRVKAQARGFRKREHIKMEIMFLCGNRYVYPES